jgi:hypothetical protein
MSELPTLEERVEDLLEKVADITRQCRACGETIYFVRHRVSGRLAPYTREAINHFANCPGAKQFKRAAGTSR